MRGSAGRSRGAHRWVGHYYRSHKSLSSYQVRGLSSDAFVGCWCGVNVQLKKYFTFEVQVLDDKNVRRRFRASNYQSTTRVKPFICTMPMRLDEGWNQIQFNLSDFTRRAYGTNYIETLRVQIHANCRIRRCASRSLPRPCSYCAFSVFGEHFACAAASPGCGVHKILGADLARQKLPRKTSQEASGRD